MSLKMGTGSSTRIPFRRLSSGEGFIGNSWVYMLLRDKPINAQ
jgi:hypothetical protein